ncbi:MAG: 30S ribosomal protein S6 [Rickettsiales bacterium]|jgi:small subunit ribosomal protein S6|nr:30S ribosomal protein S6 [Rickettsiales bacterium]
MRSYETTFIANQELTKKQIDMLADSFEDILTSHNSKVVRKEYWGVRTFAYPIKKHKRGHYMMFAIEASIEGLRDFEKKLSQLEEVMKYLTIRVKEFSGDLSYLGKQEKESSN